MSDAKSYPHGTFSWTDLMSTDAAGAKEFYTSLFGWTPVDLPIPQGGVYTMMQQDGKDVAALSQMGTEQQAQGMPSMWNSYITVDDVDAASAKVTELGGTVTMGPFDVMDAGRMSVIQDPTGGHVMLWQAKNSPGAGIFNVPNTMTWNELLTHDPDKAKEFYTELMGWETVTEENGYTMWMNNGRINGGMLKMHEEWGNVPTHWMVYFSVADCAATAEKAQKLGGTMMVPPTPAGDIGTFSVLQDPQGATFTAIQLNQIDTSMP